MGAHYVPFLGGLPPEDIILLVHFDESLPDSSIYDRGVAPQWNGSGTVPGLDLVEKKFGASSWKFTGENDDMIVVIPDKTNSTATYPPSNIPAGVRFTYEGWIYPTEDRNSTLFGWYDRSSVSGRSVVLRRLSSGVLSLRVSNSFVGVDTQQNGTIVVPLNEWSHVAMARNDAGEIYIFANGMMDTFLLESSLILGDLERMVLGGRRNSSVRYDLFKGYMDEVRCVRNHCLYEGNFTVPAAAFPNP